MKRWRTSWGFGAVAHSLACWLTMGVLLYVERPSRGSSVEDLLFVAVAAPLLVPLYACLGLLYAAVTPNWTYLAILAIWPVTLGGILGMAQFWRVLRPAAPLIPAGVAIRLQVKPEAGEPDTL